MIPPAVHDCSRTPAFSNGQIRLLSICLLLCGCAAFGRPAHAESNDAKLQAQYEAETDPVRKAKALAKLGPLQINDVRAALKEGMEEKALSLMEHYRDEVQQTTAMLRSTGIDAERHPAGFKELQISLRESLRHVDAIILALPDDKRPWFEAVRSDLSETQTSLFHELFPSADAKRSKKFAATQ